MRSIITRPHIALSIVVGASLVVASGCRTRETEPVAYSPTPAPVEQNGYSPGATVEPQGAGEAPIIQNYGTATSYAPRITDPTVLTTSDPNALVGRRVQFRNLPVQQVIDRRVVVLSADNGQSIYAASERQVAVRPGERANVTGTIEPSANSAASLALSPDSAQALSAAPVCVVAGKIEPANKMPPIGKREPTEE